MHTQEKGMCDVTRWP